MDNFTASLNEVYKPNQIFNGLLSNIHSPGFIFTLNFEHFIPVNTQHYFVKLLAILFHWFQENFSN